MMMTLIALTIAGNLLLTAIVTVIILPYARLQWRRRQSRAHIPRQGEVWLQNNESILFIQSVGINGLQIVSRSDDAPVQAWHESWSDWQERLNAHVLLFTGELRQLESPP